MSLPSSLADFVPRDYLLQKAYWWEENGTQVELDAIQILRKYVFMPIKLKIREKILPPHPSTIQIHEL